MLRVLLSLALFATAEGLHPLMALHAERTTRPLTAPIAAPLPLRAARCVPGSFRLAAEDAAAADAASAEPNAEVVDEAAEAAAEGEVVEPEEEKAEAKKEEEDDLLSSPAFLKQKVKVLEKDLMEVNEKQTELKGQELAAREEWREKRERLDTDFANYKARHYNETLSKQNDAKVRPRPHAAVAAERRRESSTEQTPSEPSAACGVPPASMREQCRANLPARHLLSHGSSRFDPPSNPRPFTPRPGCLGALIRILGSCRLSSLRASCRCSITSTAPRLPPRRRETRRLRSTTATWPCVRRYSPLSR